MKIEDASLALQNKLDEIHKPGVVSVGHDQKDNLFVLELYPKLKSYRTITEFEGFRVTYKYIGKIKPARK